MKKRDFIAQDIISKIYQKKFEGNKLPTQRDLAKKYGVSRFTIQEALKKLIDIGILYARQGDGIYIKSNIYKNPLVYNSMTENSYDNIISKTIYLKKIEPSPDIKSIFDLKEGDLVWEFQRIRIVKYQIMQIETSTIPCYLFEELTKDDIEGSIQNYVENKYNISHYIVKYRPINVSKEQAELLQCKKGTAAMEISNRGILNDGTIYELSKVIALDYNCAYILPFNKENHKERQKIRK